MFFQRLVGSQCGILRSQAVKSERSWFESKVCQLLAYEFEQFILNCNMGNTFYFSGILWGDGEKIDKKHLAQCPWQSKHSINDAIVLSVKVWTDKIASCTETEGLKWTPS